MRTPPGGGPLPATPAARPSSAAAAPVPGPSPAVLPALLPVPALLLLHEPLLLGPGGEVRSLWWPRGLGCRCEPRLRGRLGLLDESVVRRRQLPRRGRRGLRRGLRHRHRWASKVRCAAGLASPNRAHRLRRHPVPYVYRGGHRQLSRTRRRLGPGGAAPAGVPFGRRHHAPDTHDVPAKAPHSATLVGPEGAPSLRVEAHAQEVACRVGSSNDPILCRSWCLVKDRSPLARAGAARREARQVRELHRVVVRRLLLFLVLLVVLVGVVFLRRPFGGRLSRASSLTASSMPRVLRALPSRGGGGAHEGPLPAPCLCGAGCGSLSTGPSSRLRCSRRSVTVRSFNQSLGSTCPAPATPALPPQGALGPPGPPKEARGSASEGPEGPDSRTESDSAPAPRTEGARPLKWLESSVPAARAGASAAASSPCARPVSSAPSSLGFLSLRPLSPSGGRRLLCRLALRPGLASSSPPAAASPANPQTVGQGKGLCKGPEPWLIKPQPERHEQHGRSPRKRFEPGAAGKALREEGQQAATSRS